MVLLDEFPDPPWKPYYIGSQGPFYFDTSATYLEGLVDEHGSPLTQKAFLSGGQIRVEETPVDDRDILRKVDVVGGLANVTIPAGFSLIFKGITPYPDARIAYASGYLVIYIGTTVVARWRITS